MPVWVSEQTEDYLNQLNQRLLAAIEKSGEAFISNAVIAGKYALRFCIVNFRASTGDIEAMPQLSCAWADRLTPNCAIYVATLFDTNLKNPQKQG